MLRGGVKNYIVVGEISINWKQGLLAGGGGGLWWWWCFYRCEGTVLLPLVFMVLYDTKLALDIEIRFAFDRASVAEHQRKFQIRPSDEIC